MKSDDLEKFFESIYNESLQRFTEIGKNNFWAKINANKTGRSYAQSFLQLDRTGQTTPINLSGNLKKERYNWGNDVVNGTQHFTKNGDFNSFLIEKIYEELLLDEFFESVFNATHLKEDTPKAYAKSLHDKVLGKAVKAHQNSHDINYVEFNKARAPLDHVVVDENGNAVNGANDFAGLVVNAYHALFPKENVEDSLLRKAAEDYFNRK